MLLFTFEANGQTYGLDLRSISQVAPYPACTRLQQAPAYIAGLVTWRRRTVPVIDISVLLGGTPARPLLSTRLLVIDYHLPDGSSQPLGLLVEKGVEIVRQEENRCEPQKVRIPEAPYLDGTAEHNGLLIQKLAVEELLPLSVRQLLFPKPEAA